MAGNPDPAGAPQVRWGDVQALAAPVISGGGLAAQPNVNALTLLLTGLEVNLADDALTGAAVAALRVPVTIPEEHDFLGYVCDLRGGLAKTAGAWLAVSFDFGTVSRQWVYEYGEDAPKDGVFFQRVAALDERLPKSSGGDRPPLPPLAITLTLTAQRRTPDDGALITVTSLDIRSLFG